VEVQEMKAFWLAVGCAVTIAGVFAQQKPPKTHLKVGDQAPDFTIAANMNTSGKPITLSDFRGKKPVVLAFFPAAFTGG
jgi:peroxiredoxin